MQYLSFSVWLILFSIMSSKAHLLLLLSHFSRVRLCDPTDCSLPGFSIHGILQARTLEWVAISFSNAWKWKLKVKSLSCVWLLETPWTAAYQAPPSMGFSRQQNSAKQSRKTNKKKILKREDSLKDQWDSIKYNKIYITGVSEEEQEKKEQKAYSKKQWLKLP